jgi:RNA polymerase sigma factor for flagellar operon FliA
MSSALNDPTSYGIPIQEVWDAYFAEPIHGGSDEDRLCRAYLPLVKQVCDRLYANIPNNVEYDEVLQNGRIGLLDAIRAWKPEVASFRTYATLKIRSKILDGLRSADWLSRDMRRSVRAVQTGIVELEKELNRTPSDEEVAAHLGLTVHEIQTALLNHSTSHVGSLDDILPNRGGGDGASTSLGAHVTDATDMSPHDHVERKQDAELLRQAIETLPDRDRQILALYYYENLTLSNIGEILGVTESRICQVRSKALIVLQSKLSIDQD